MKLLVAQLQPDRAPAFDAALASDRLRRLGEEAELAEHVRVSERVEDGRYIDIEFTTRDAPRLWNRLRQELRINTQLAACTIICCQGDAGWDDYCCCTTSIRQSRWTSLHNRIRSFGAGAAARRDERQRRARRPLRGLAN